MGHHSVSWSGKDQIYSYLMLSQHFYVGEAIFVVVFLDLQKMFGNCRGLFQ